MNLLLISENGDIFGDAVNIASRIQSLGTAGCILFSKKITNEIKNKSEFRTVSLGRFEFKNVNEPIEVFALANDGFAVRAKNRMKGKLKDNPKKRVLKFGLLGLLIISFGLFGYYTLTTLNHNRAVTAIRNGAIAIIPFESHCGFTFP